MIVWPALLPPWKRTTTSAFSAIRSTTLPLPSSPHWAPTMTIPGTAVDYGGAVRRRLQIGLVAVVAALDLERPELAAHLDEPGDGAGADLLLELRLFEVRRHEHRALGAIALIDDRIELLQHP